MTSALYDVTLIDHITPEEVAMLQALYSRSAAPELDDWTVRRGGHTITRKDGGAL